MSQKSPVSIVLLAHNEARTIEKEILSFHEKIAKRLPGSEIVVAEDGSTDGTTEIIQGLARSIGVRHLTSKERLGYAKALANAVLACRHEHVFFSDTGLKFDPDEFWRLHQHIDRFDLIVGRRVERQDQLYRQLLTSSYNFYLRHKFGLPDVHDADSGFRLFNRKVVDEVFRKGVFFVSLVGSEVVVKTILGGLRYLEVPVSYRQREGESRGMPPRTILKQIRNVVRDLDRVKGGR